MKVRMAVGAAVIALGVYTQTMAVSDGNSLIVECTDTVRALNGQQPNSSIGAASCLGLVTGVMDTLTIVNDSMPRKEQICFPPQGIQYGQGVRIVLQYLTTHPAHLQKRGVLLAVVALQDAFPCQ